MALDNCPSCGKAFNKTTRTLCPACWERERVLYDHVSEYLHEHPEAEAPEVVEQTGIHHEDLEYLIKRGRLLGFERLASSILRCYRCQESTSRGPYCTRCVALLKSEAQSAAAEDAQHERPRPKHEVRSHTKTKDDKHPGHSAEYWRTRAHR